jgi:hypothetical protein
MSDNNPFADLVPPGEFGARLPTPRCERTIQRWTELAQDPLPCVRLPKGKLIHLGTGLAWLMGRMRTRNDRRGRRKQ